MSASSAQGKVVWVTGASSGIGEALAHELAARGARLVLSARREGVLRSVQQACQRSNEHFVLPLDLLDQTSLAPAVQNVLQHFGCIDILIHCAGISQRDRALDTQLEVDRRIMELNYFGPIGLTKLVLPTMIERRSGHIVVISSLLGEIVAPERSAYCASKHALHGFFGALRAEEHAHGISVTLVCPGFVRTNASRNALTGEGQPHGKLDELITHGLDPAVCARRVVHGIERRQRQVYIGKKEVLGIYLNRWLPGLFHRLIRDTKLK